MRIVRALVAAGLAVSLSGCASLLSQFTDPAVGSDHLDEWPPELSKIKELSGDRRLVRVVAYATSDVAPDFRSVAESDRRGAPPIYYKYRVCAETQADAIAARGAKSSLTVEKEGAFSDEVTQLLTATNQRSELSEVVRQLAWHLCNARLNDYLTGPEYADALIKLQTAALEAVKAKSSVGPEKAAAEKAAGEADKSAKAAAASEAAAKAAAEKAAGKK